MTWRRMRGCSFFGGCCCCCCCCCGGGSGGAVGLMGERWWRVAKCERTERGVLVRECVLGLWWRWRDCWLRRLVVVGDRRCGGVSSSCMPRTDEGLRKGERVLGGVYGRGSCAVKGTHEEARESVGREEMRSSLSVHSSSKCDSHPDEVRGELWRVECDSGFESKMASSPPAELRAEAEWAESEKDSSMLWIGISLLGEEGRRIGCAFRSIVVCVCVCGMLVLVETSEGVRPFSFGVCW